VLKRGLFICGSGTLNAAKAGDAKGFDAEFLTGLIANNSPVHPISSVKSSSGHRKITALRRMGKRLSEIQAR